MSKLFVIVGAYLWMWNVDGQDLYTMLKFLLTLMSTVEWSLEICHRLSALFFQSFKEYQIIYSNWRSCISINPILYERIPILHNKWASYFQQYA